MNKKTERYQINIRVKKHLKNEISVISKKLKKSTTEALLEGWELLKKQNGFLDIVMMTKKEYQENMWNVGRLRSRLYSFLNKNTTPSKEVLLYIGCDREELKKYLESKFTEGMTWDNRGRYGWHLDHIIPLSSFDLRKKSEILKGMHYTNIQPLWAKDNVRKSNKMPDGTRGKRVIHK